MKEKEHTHNTIGKGKYKDKYDPKTLEIYLWEDGAVSISRDGVEPAFVLTNSNRKKLIKLLQKKEVRNLKEEDK